MLWRKVWSLSTRFVTLLMFVLVSPSTASDALVYGKGLLWRIDGGRAKPSYLFGTIHTSDARVLQVPVAVAKSFATADSFSAEILLDNATLMELSGALFFPDDTNLKSLLPRDVWDAVRVSMAKRGVAESQLARMKPWGVLMRLSLPAEQSGTTLDMSLYHRAQAKGKRLYGLETVQEQLAVLDDLPLQDQVALLQETLAQESQLDAIFEQMHRLYLRQDVAQIARLYREQMQGENPELNQRLMTRMLDERNTRMVARMTARLEEGNAFIAVGALHLPGEAGLLRLLEQRGYTLTRVE